MNMIVNNENSTPIEALAETLSPKTTDESVVYYCEDLHVGQVWESPSRTITSEDVEQFSALTGDFDPLHKGELAKASPFGRPVAHGLLGLSVLAGLSTEHPRAATLALVGISDWQFENPIFFGEVVHVVTKVTAIQPHGRRAGRVTWLRTLVSDDGRTLQQGCFVTLVASQSRNRAAANLAGSKQYSKQPSSKQTSSTSAPNRPR